MADPCQVDWNYQIQHKPSAFPAGGPAGGDLTGTYPDPIVRGLQTFPVSNTPPSAADVLTWDGLAWSPLPGGGASVSLAGVNPVSGPFMGSAITVDSDTGLIPSAGPSLALAMASLTQKGGVSTAGGQQLRGPIYLAPTGAAASPPAWNALAWPVVLQNGGLAFRLDGDGAQAAPAAYLEYAGKASGQGLTVVSPSELNLWGGLDTGGLVQIHNYAAPSSIIMDDAGAGIAINDYDLISLQVTPTLDRRVEVYPVGGLVNSFYCDLVDGTAHFPSFAIQGVPGIYSTLLDGTVVAGGIVVTRGTTANPAPPNGAAGGDLAGTYPNPTVVAMHNGGGTVVLSGAGRFHADAAAGQEAQIAANGGRVTVTNGGQVFMVGAPGQNVGLTAGTTQLVMHSSGDFLVTLATTNKLGFFGLPGIAQYFTASVTAGFVQNASVNVVYSGSTFSGGFGFTHYTIGDIVAALKGYGLLVI